MTNIMLGLIIVNIVFNIVAFAYLLAGYGVDITTPTVKEQKLAEKRYSEIDDDLFGNGMEK